jgi:hypothetical protein
MSGTNESSGAGGSWTRRIMTGPFLCRAARGMKRLCCLPGLIVAGIARLAPFQRRVEDQLRKLSESQTALHRLLADLLPKMHQDAQAGRQEVAHLTNEALPEMRTASTEAREEVRRLKHRYAEYYGALVEQLREQNRRLDRLADQQERALRLLANSSDVLALEEKSQQLPQAG